MADDQAFSSGKLTAMSGLNSTTVIIVFITTFIMVYLNTRRKPGVPPGPALWPIVGNLFSLAGNDTLATLSQLRNKYGDVFGVYIGTELTIFLNGYEAIHDALVKNGTSFARRPVTFHSKLFLRNVSVVFGNGNAWKTRKKFVLNSLNDICFKSKGTYVEGIIHEEISHFVNYIESSDKPIDIHGHVNMSFANVMHSVVLGRRTEYDNPSFKWYLNLLDTAFKTFTNQQILINCFPFVMKLPFDVSGIKASHKKEIHLKEFFINRSESVRKSMDSEKTNSLAESYFSLMEQDKYQEYFNKDNMWVMFHDLMAAGSETSATTIQWILLYLVLNPELQNKLYEEIVKVIGPYNLPSISDRAEMPLSQATILEGLRIGCVVPLAVPHAVSRDFKLHGHLIPKDVTVLANVGSVLMDPEIFQDPKSFKPERYLSSDSTKLNVPKEFIPFSLGPRSCIGESLARLELFLYLTTLIQNFELEVPAGEIPSTDGVFGLTHQPKPFKIFFRKRNNH